MINAWAENYNMTLIALAAFICILGCFTTTSLMSRARLTTRPATYKWLTATATVFGLSVWSLHFVAMLAYMPDMPMSYMLAPTVLSVLVAVVGSLAGFSIWRLVRSRFVQTVFGGVVLGLAVTGMHYTGELAMRAPGEVAFDTGVVIESIVVCLVCSTIALGRARRLTGILRRIEVSMWLTVSICGVHFIGMAALDITPDMQPPPVGAVLGSDALALVVAAASLALLAASSAAIMMDAHLSKLSARELHRMRLLSDFAQEGILIHRRGVVLEINKAGVRLFGHPASAIVGNALINLFADKHVGVLSRSLECPSEFLIPQEVEIKTTSGAGVLVEFTCRVIEFEGKPAIAVALRDLTDRYRSEAKIRHLAHHDCLTDLPNRFLLKERLGQALALAAQNNTRAAILYLDLDRFKPVNDMFGHATGDALLVQVSKRLNAEVRTADTLARVGGDEFIIVQVDAASEEKVASLACRLIAALSQPFDLVDAQIQIGVSIGVALYPADGADAEKLLHAADAAMYLVKQSGRGGVRFFDASMEGKLLDRTLLEQDLRRAVERNELVLHYQPVVNGRTGDTDTFEALMRWRHPTRGMIPPGEFIPVAEAIGVIGQLGQWAVETACREAARWTNNASVAVNVSPSQFQQSNLLETIAAALDAAGLDPARLEVEITEGSFIDDAPRAVKILTGLRALGVRLALDDFGTGYSSLSYLRLFRFDKIKIDQSFIRDLDRDDESTQIVKAIINLAHNLSLEITAEGVETGDQVAFLQAQGIDRLQGYLFGRPVESAILTELQIARIRTTLSGVRAPALAAG